MWFCKQPGKGQNYLNQQLTLILKIELNMITFQKLHLRAELQDFTVLGFLNQLQHESFKQYYMADLQPALIYAQHILMECSCL